MKNTRGVKMWIAALFAVGVVCLHTLPSAAQDGQAAEPVAETTQIPAAGTTDIVSNFVATETILDATTPVHAEEHAPFAWGRDVVKFGTTFELKANETAHDIFVMWGSAIARGKVHGDAVAIFGNITIENDANDVVAVFGNVKLGTNANVRGDAVAVFGNVTVQPHAHVSKDTVAVFGAVNKGDGATIGGDVVDFLAFTWIGDWLEHCLFKLRPLAPQLGWLWVITFIMLLLYFLVILAFPRPVNACAKEIAERPATTLLVGMLTKFLLLPLIFIILLITGVGVLVVPFLMAAVFLAAIVGKVALCLYFGRRFRIQNPLMGFLIGWVIVTALFMVPVLGLLVWALVGLWSLGAAVMSLVGGARRELPSAPTVPAPPAAPISGMNIPATAAFSASPMTTAFSAPGAEFSSAATTASYAGQSTTAMSPPLPLTAIATDALAFPRATFWERMAAGFLDVILVSVVSAPLGFPLALFSVALAYFAGMWAWRGTTIGGIVLNLRVIRYDGQTPNFAAALVRGLTSMFSILVFFLGFFWIAWDPQKQGWHDKIAGTIVVRQPQGTPLLCL